MWPRDGARTMQFLLCIDSDNSAFEGDHRNPEIARILRGVANKLEFDDELQGIDTYHLRDINGNTVGLASFKEDSGA